METAANFNFFLISKVLTILFTVFLYQLVKEHSWSNPSMFTFVEILQYKEFNRLLHTHTSTTIALRILTETSPFVYNQKVCVNAKLLLFS